MFFYVLMGSALICPAQAPVLKGQVTDRRSNEPIPFVSISLVKSTQGTLTDTAGRFTFSFSRSANDTLSISSVGYVPLKLALARINDSAFINIKMDIAPVGKDAVVRVKYDRALWLWKRIMSHKDQHDQGRYLNYRYEVYNKMELDLNNVDKEKLAGKKVFKNFNFILNNVDTTEGKPYLPVFLTESLSDYYFQRSPRRTLEVIRASNTHGINNESVTRLLGATYQNINAYNNYIPVLDKQFASPFNSNGDNLYRFRLLDTQYLGGTRLVHLGFTPKQKGTNTFEGDCWIADSVYAIQKITLRPAANADINFVDNITLIQEYRLVNDSTWFLSKDKFVADLSPMGKGKAGFKGRKTTTYRQVQYNDTSITARLLLNKKPEEIFVSPTAETQGDTFWDSSRHDVLSKNEQAIYTMIDTIQAMPNYKKYLEAINFIGTGYLNLGNTS